MRAAIILKRVAKPLRAPLKGITYCRTVPRPDGWTTSIEDEQRWHQIIRRANLKPR